MSFDQPPPAGPPGGDRFDQPVRPVVEHGATSPVLGEGAPAPPAPPPSAGTSRLGGPALVVAVAIVAVLAGAALFLSGFSMGRQLATTPGTPPGEQEDFQAFWDAYRAITERYAGGEIDRKALIEGAIEGMIQSLGDPYSSYLTSEEYRESLRGISGEFEGIGAEIGTQAPDGTTNQCATLAPDCRLVIVAPLDGSPAERAGLRPGDLVLAADGSTLDGLTIDEARDRIRGPKGTQVVLTIEREGREPFEVSITRDTIISREVIEEDLADGTVGYIQLTGFSDHAADTLEEALAEDIEAGRTKIVLDLRGNPGGFVTAARDVASQFIGSGTIFWQEDAKGALTETTALPGGAATDPDVRLVVLVDRGSASASEIVAGAVRDRDRGILIGESTFGKGTVQQWTPLEDDHGGFRLTVAKWLTPDKEWIHGEGIEPDVPVEVPPDVAPGADPVLDAALEVLAREHASVP